MTIFEAQLNDKQQWNDFVSSQTMGGFTQSWEWGDFNAKIKDKIFRFIVKNDNDWLATMFLFKSKVKLGQNTLYAPRGPVMRDGLTNEQEGEAMTLILEKINELAKTEKSLNFSFELLTEEKSWTEIFKKLNLKKAKSNIQPKYTLILNIEKSSEDLLKDMHQKTRYNIRLAEKKNVKVFVDNSRVNEFYNLLQKTESRKQVKFFSKKYFEEILKLPFAKLYLAQVNGKIVSANIMIFWNKTATYLFGGTDNAFRAVMAPHLAQWQAILDAQKVGCQAYDFWGAAVAGSTEEKKWGGVTRFKQGFAPEQAITEYLGTYEKAYKPLVLGIYRFLQRF
jgi:peptidoglycan pentaglycine glycine transferase (the first glycine)